MPFKKKTKTPRYLKTTFSGLVMLVAGFAGGYKVREQITPPPAVHVPEGNVQVRFSPKKGCEAMLIKAMLQAKKTLEIAIFDLTSTEIADALLNLHKKGVHLRIVADNRQSKTKHSKLPLLYRQGIPIRIGRFAGVMHHKFAIIDNGKGGMLTGSFNYSYGAEHKNAENLLWIKSPSLAKLYQEEWHKIWSNSKTYSP